MSVLCEEVSLVCCGGMRQFEAGGRQGSKGEQMIEISSTRTAGISYSSLQR